MDEELTFSAQDVTETLLQRGRHLPSEFHAEGRASGRGSEIERVVLRWGPGSGSQEVVPSHWSTQGQEESATGAEGRLGFS